MSATGRPNRVMRNGRPVLRTRSSAARHVALNFEIGIASPQSVPCSKSMVTSRAGAAVVQGAPRFPGSVRHSPGRWFIARPNVAASVRYAALATHEPRFFEGIAKGPEPSPAPAVCRWCSVRHSPGRWFIARPNVASRASGTECAKAVILQR